jgi:hypothetical protein
MPSSGAVLPDWMASQSSCRFWSDLRRMFSSMVF